MDENSKRWWDPWAAFFLVVALLISASRLSATHWTPHLELIQYLSVLGVALGLALGYSRFAPYLTKLMAVVYGLFFVPWVLGLVLNPGVTWDERLVIMGERVQSAWVLFVNRKPVPDPILFLLLMSLLFWILSVSASYYLTRYSSPWMTVLPTCLVLLIVNHYDRLAETGLRYVALFLLVGLLLIGRLTYLRNRTGWQQQGIFFTSENGEHLGRATAILAIFLVAFAWTAPVMTSEGVQPGELWETITRPWNTLRSRLADAFTALQARAVPVQDFYGTNMALGSGTRLGNDVLFTVRAAELPLPGLHYYWRARSYDTYLDGQWTSSLDTLKKLTPDAYPLTFPNWSGRKSVEFIFAVRANQQNVPSGPLPEYVSRPVQAIYGPAEDGKDDLVGLLAQPPLQAGEVYRVRSLVSNPTVLDMRQSGTNYPAWVTQRYLELPVKLSPKISELAHTITKGMNNPYDMANSITNYLRQTITYKETIPPPPPNQDPIEWFLFNIKQGFCNYYATAEVLMLRSVGIPARIAVGYAEGAYDPQTDLYTVMQKDSHAWPEVFFNNMGWIEFEPTVSIPARLFASGGAYDPTPTPPAGSFAGPSSDRPPIPTPPLGGFGPSAADLLRQQRQRQLIIIVLGSLLILGILAFGFFRFARPRLKKTPLPVMIENGMRVRKLAVPGWIQRWSWRVRLSPFEREFGILDHAHWVLGKRASTSLTPAERAASLASLLPEATGQAQILLAEYHQAEYSPHPADLQRARTAGREIRMLAYRAFLRRHLTNRA